MATEAALGVSSTTTSTSSSPIGPFCHSTDTVGADGQGTPPQLPLERDEEPPQPSCARTAATAVRRMTEIPTS
ncbi:MAG: hypothetical protein ABUR63_04420 [Verrucomicrobiota bacterium]